ncbi:unnamed protein product [Ceratitis capitata]|uniref:(Mediterranean fruit fly) hypothetical protein n=1 Tax=Ceratitis capitata TaxID=7213 RepID=A0A811U7B4_CERCA|nr:unnamed protein product [Ceratitis capitata]
MLKNLAWMPGDCQYSTTVSPNTYATTNLRSFICPLYSCTLKPYFSVRPKMRKREEAAQIIHYFAINELSFNPAWKSLNPRYESSRLIAETPKDSEPEEADPEPTIGE